MYGRSGEVGTQDLSFFVGSTLVQVCLGAYDLGLNFDGPPSINVMISSSFGIQSSKKALTRHDVTEGHLLRPFLNRDIIGAKWAEQGTLVLTFEGDDQIHVFDDSDQFESYSVKNGQILIFV